MSLVVFDYGPPSHDEFDWKEIAHDASEVDHRSVIDVSVRLSEDLGHGNWSRTKFGRKEDTFFIQAFENLFGVTHKRQKKQTFQYNDNPNKGIFECLMSRNVGLFAV